MDVTQLFNILLLTLSLATILLTLVSYVLYRFGQLPGRSEGAKSGTKIEGIFFTRYVPTAVATLGVVSPVLAVVKSKLYPARFFPKNVAFFFLVTVAIVFASLVFRTYLSNRVKLRGSPGDLIATLQGYRTLGVLKNYDFLVEPTKGLLDEKLGTNAEKNLESLLVLLRKKQIFIFDSLENEKQNGAIAGVAIKQWGDLLHRFNLPFKVGSTLASAHPGDLLLLPQTKVLTDVQRAKIEELRKQGVGLVSTGPLGILNKVAARDSSNSATKWTGVKFVPNSAPEEVPTLFSTENGAGWELPSGMLLNAFPSDNSFAGLPISGKTMALESDYHGYPRMREGGEITRAQFTAVGSARSVWLAADPVEIREIDESSLFYFRTSFANALAWAAKVPTVRVSTWRSHLPAAVLLSVDSEDRFENVDRFKQMFNQAKLPATFFVVSNLFQKHPELVGEDSVLFEIASHSENHATFADLSPDVQFERIQVSRFEIEEITKTPVRGFRAPEEKFEVGTIDAAIQNRLTYFAGDARVYRYAPEWIADGRILYYPRTMADDFATIKIMKDEQKIATNLMEDYRRARRMGGLYLLNLHTHIFGLPPFEKPLTSFFTQLSEEKAWKTTYHEMTEWWRDRSAVHLTLKSQPTVPGEYLLVVVNDGKGRTQELDVELSFPEFPLRVKELPDGESHLVSGESAGQGVLVVSGINPGQARTYLIQPSGAR